jgi:kynurenine formamidase
VNSDRRRRRVAGRIAQRVHEFLFVCLALSVRGATGSMVRPVAIA